MATTQTSADKNFFSDFKGRYVTAVAVTVAAAGSACLNIWGATHIFPNDFAAAVFGVVIGACEVLAAIVLMGIMKDHDNNRYWKARAGAFMMLLAVIGCVLSGKQAFHVLFLEATAVHKSLEVRATARQAEADAYHIKLLAGTAHDNPDTAKARWENKQELADKATLEAAKAEPPHKAIVYILLALFESLKIGGLYVFATATTRGQTKAQRRAAKRTAKLREVEALAAYERKLAAAKDPEDVDANNVVSIAS